MCWSTFYPEDYAKPKIAKTNKKVIKICQFNSDGQIVPMYFNNTDFEYKVGEVKKLKYPIVVSNGVLGDALIHIARIYTGFHSYNPKKVNIQIFGNEKSVKDSTIFVDVTTKENGIHLDFLSDNNDCYILCIFVIPKGTIYYENDDGCVVSEAIKLVSYDKIKNIKN